MRIFTIGGGGGGTLAGSTPFLSLFNVALKTFSDAFIAASLFARRSWKQNKSLISLFDLHYLH